MRVSTTPAPLSVTPIVPPNPHGDGGGAAPPRDGLSLRESGAPTLRRNGVRFPRRPATRWTETPRGARRKGGGRGGGRGGGWGLFPLEPLSLHCAATSPSKMRFAERDRVPRRVARHSFLGRPVGHRGEPLREGGGGNAVSSAAGGPPLRSLPGPSGEVNGAPLRTPRGYRATTPALGAR